MRKAKVIRKKVGTGVPNIQKIVNTLLANNSKTMDIEVIKSKYLNYKTNFDSAIKNLTIIDAIIKDYEPASEVILRAFVDGYDKFFKFTNENPTTEDETNAFYENYDDFKSSKLCVYLTRIAGKIVESGIKSKWNDIQKMAAMGLLRLDIFNKVIDDVSGPYDLSVYFHSNYTIPRNVLKKNREDIRDALRELALIGRNVYKLIKSPDIPVGLLFDQFRECLGKYRKDVRGVERLFTQMDKSGALFEEHFIDYYKEFIKNGNPMDMFSAFLKDVAHQPGIGDKKLVLECGVLLKALRKDVGMAPPGHSAQATKIVGMLDSILEFIDENPGLGETEELCEEDIKKMISEIQTRFGTTE